MLGAPAPGRRGAAARKGPVASGQRGPRWSLPSERAPHVRVRFPAPCWMGSDSRRPTRCPRDRGTRRRVGARGPRQPDAASSEHPGPESPASSELGAATWGRPRAPQSGPPPPFPAGRQLGRPHGSPSCGWGGSRAGAAPVGQGPRRRHLTPRMPPPAPQPPPLPR